jgi:predicted  nucleic acid-binding Zn-ribbon protein
VETEDIATGDANLQVNAEKDEEIAELKMRLAHVEKEHAPCPELIASLRSDLDSAEAAHAQCDDQISELTVHVARLRGTVSTEHRKVEAIAEELAEEKCNATELAAKLRQTALDLDTKEQKLLDGKRVSNLLSCPCRFQEACVGTNNMNDCALQAMERSEAEVADLRMRIVDMEQKHAPCEDVIASLRKQNSALHLTREHAEVCCDIRSNSRVAQCVKSKNEGLTTDTDMPYASHTAGCDRCPETRTRSREGAQRRADQGAEGARHAPGYGACPKVACGGGPGQAG